MTITSPQSGIQGRRLGIVLGPSHQALPASSQEDSDSPPGRQHGAKHGHLEELNRQQASVYSTATSLSLQPILAQPLHRSPAPAMGLNTATLRQTHSEVRLLAGNVDPNVQHSQGSRTPIRRQSKDHRLIAPHLRGVLEIQVGPRVLVVLGVLESPVVSQEEKHARSEGGGAC